MSFANSSYTDVITTTLQKRSKKIADNVTGNNALIAYLNKRGNVRPFNGGRTIVEELSFAENGNAGWYSGYDVLPTAPQDVISAAEYSIKQLACPVAMSGLEELQNSGEEAIIDLMDARMGVAEGTMANLLSEGAYSSGTSYGGKQIGGLGALVPTSSTSGTVGGIDRATWTFWQSVTSTGYSGTEATTTIQNSMNAVWAQLVRGADRPDLLVCDAVFYAMFEGSLQGAQRFTSEKAASLGFNALKYKDADVILDGGLGGDCTASTCFFLNTKYLFLRPHSKRNMVPLNPSRRLAVNQDASVAILGWAGNMTMSNSKLQGRLTIS